MKKIFVILLLAVASVTTIKAQSLSDLIPIEFGVKAGMNVVDVDVNDVASSVFKADARNGYHFGVMARLSILGLYVQPELLYNSNKVEYTLYDGGLESYEYKINTIDIPIMAGVKLGLFRLGAGVNFTLYDNTDGMLFNDNSPLAKEAISSYILGAGFNLWGLNFDARYLRNFKATEQTITISDQVITPTISRSSYQFSVGYMF